EPPHHRAPARRPDRSRPVPHRLRRRQRRWGCRVSSLRVPAGDGRSPGRPVREPRREARGADCRRRATVRPADQRRRRRRRRRGGRGHDRRGEVRGRLLRDRGGVRLLLEPGSGRDAAADRRGRTGHPGLRAGHHRHAGRRPADGHHPQRPRLRGGRPGSDPRGRHPRLRPGPGRGHL
ncbi:MAG: Peptidylprolyl isomerase, FKBP-type, partial [uncultured Blastococcus sp.]